MLGPGTTVLCQNEIRAEETFAILVRARRRGARTILNMAPAGHVPPEVLGALDVLVVNEIEAETVAGVSGAPPEAVARRLATTYGLTCVVTLGGAGCVAVTAAEGWRTPVLPIRPVDTMVPGLVSDSSGVNLRIRSTMARTRPPTKMGIVVESGR